jgi:hypothetical protein
LPPRLSLHFHPTWTAMPYLLCKLRTAGLAIWGACRHLGATPKASEESTAFAKYINKSGFQGIRKSPPGGANEKHWRSNTPMALGRMIWAEAKTQLAQARRFAATKLKSIEEAKMSEATMTQSAAKSEVSGGMQRVAQLLSKDLNAMSNEVLASCPGGKARCGFDLVYELAEVNRMMASLIRGESKEVSLPDSWTLAPADYRSKEQAQADLQGSINELLAAFENVPEDKLEEDLSTPLGQMPAGKLMAAMNSHMMYHSGQLNYIQTIHGDDAFHWA